MTGIFPIACFSTLRAPSPLALRTLNRTLKHVKNKMVRGPREDCDSQV